VFIGFILNPERCIQTHRTAELTQRDATRLQPSKVSKPQPFSEQHAAAEDPTAAAANDNSGYNVGRSTIEASV